MSKKLTINEMKKIAQDIAARKALNLQALNDAKSDIRAEKKVKHANKPVYVPDVKIEESQKSDGMKLYEAIFAKYANTMRQVIRRCGGIAGFKKDLFYDYTKDLKSRSILLKADAARISDSDDEVLIACRCFVSDEHIRRMRYYAKKALSNQ